MRQNERFRCYTSIFKALYKEITRRKWQKIQQTKNVSTKKLLILEHLGKTKIKCQEKCRDFFEAFHEIRFFNQTKWR